MISSQEVRIEDYIRAYQATGRPPPPCPQEPSDETQRKLLNLPPLFKPHTPSSTSALDPPMDGAGANLGILNPSELPRGQEFRVYSNAGEKYHCISTMPEFTNFCQEVRVLLVLRSQEHITNAFFPCRSCGAMHISRETNNHPSQSPWIPLFRFPSNKWGHPP